VGFRFQKIAHFLELNCEMENLSYYNNSNNNNNLFLRSQSSQHIKLVYETLLFMGQGTHRDLTSKVYEGIHTLPPSGFEPVTS
jgi:hypothetical protein